MLIGATRTERGRRKGSADGEDQPFLMWLDQPSATTVSSAVPLLRVEGWVVSAADEPATVRATLAGSPPVEVIADDPRDDVLPLIPQLLPHARRADGFRFHVALPEPFEEPVCVELAVTDGTSVGTVEVRVVPGEDERPARADYKATWNAVAVDEDSAKLSVAGYTDEDVYTRMGNLTVSTLESTVGIHPDDVILEIGAGVGRVGPSLAPRCRRWIATDVSGHMLAHARRRLAQHDNVDFVEISGWDLAPIESESVDVVYCTVVFMHLDEWERFRYVVEAMRVLRPGGRVYIDNFNLLSEPGWAFFMETLERYHPLERPPNISKSSTPEELRRYLEQAGFVDIQGAAVPQDMWVVAWAAKPQPGQS
ncbi:MAG: class I SAM-dependent methyltransferase [Acidimicrobiia bacterium]